MIRIEYVCDECGGRDGYVSPVESSIFCRACYSVESIPRLIKEEDDDFIRE